LAAGHHNVYCDLSGCYDGTVFQIGYTSPEMEEEDAKNDYMARLYTMDERPYYGEEYQCFTLTNE